jgi:hypothetical protein
MKLVADFILEGTSTYATLCQVENAESSLRHRDWWCVGSFHAMNEGSKTHSTLYLLWNLRPIE